MSRSAHSTAVVEYRHSGDLRRVAHRFVDEMISATANRSPWKNSRRIEERVP